MIKVKAILDLDEAQSVGLDMNGYSSDGENRVTIVAISKKEAAPFGMITILKGDWKYILKSKPIDNTSIRQFDQQKAGNGQVCCYEVQ